MVLKVQARCWHISNRSYGCVINCIRGGRVCDNWFITCMMKIFFTPIWMTMVVRWLMLAKWLMITAVILWFLSLLLSSILSCKSCCRRFAYGRWRRRWRRTMVRIAVTSLSSTVGSSSMVPLTRHLSWWWLWKCGIILYGIKCLCWRMSVRSTSTNASIIRISIISTVAVVLIYDMRGCVVRRSRGCVVNIKYLKVDRWFAKTMV